MKVYRKWFAEKYNLEDGWVEGVAVPLHVENMVISEKISQFEARPDEILPHMSYWNIDRNVRLGGCCASAVQSLAWCWKAKNTAHAVQWSARATGDRHWMTVRRKTYPRALNRGNCRKRGKTTRLQRWLYGFLDPVLSRPYKRTPPMYHGYQKACQ